MNCPIFSAAPRNWVSLETRRFTLPSVSISEGACFSPGLVVRLSNSVAAPYPREAARPWCEVNRCASKGAYTHLRNGRTCQSARMVL